MKSPESLAAKCADCGTGLNEGEAKCFTVCDACWDKAYPSKPTSEAQRARDHYSMLLMDMAKEPDAPEHVRLIAEITRLKADLKMALASSQASLDFAREQSVENNRLRADRLALVAAVRDECGSATFACTIAGYGDGIQVNHPDDPADECRWLLRDPAALLAAAEARMRDEDSRTEGSEQPSQDGQHHPDSDPSPADT